MGVFSIQAVQMYYYIFIISIIGQSVASENKSYSKTVEVTYKGTTKTLSCDITVVFNGNEVDTDASSITDFSINWPKKRKTRQEKYSDRFRSRRRYWKKILCQCQIRSVQSEKNIVFEKQDENIEDPTSPVDLWCPAENTIIWTPEHDFVDESSLNTWQECAELCATLVNENGNAPCFSWTYNNAAEEKYGLPAGVCRLLPYSPVYRMEAMDVQSGYWKCWDAYQDYNA